MTGYVPMHTIIPEGSRGLAAVRHFDITDQGGIHDVIRGRGTANGRYAGLFVGSTLMMSDTDAEKESNLDAVYDARGDVLIGGLGLGMVVVAMLRRAHVRTVTVVEKHQDVIDLVGPPLLAWAEQHAAAAQKIPVVPLTIVRGDVFTWRPVPGGRQFDYIYFDIWPNISTDDLKEHTALHVRFRPYLRKGGRVTSWQHAELLWRTR